MDGKLKAPAVMHVPPDTAGLYELIIARARTRAIFVEWENDTFRYDALVNDIRSFCGLFDRYGLTPGEHVMVATDNERRAIGAFVAALLDGLVPVMLTPETPAPRAEAIAELLAPGLVLLDAERSGSEQWARAYPPRSR